MAALSQEQSFRARKNLGVIFTALSNIGQVSVAKALSISESQLSKMKTEDLPVLADLLAACELKIVPETFRCYDPKTIDAILALAQDRLSRIRGSAELEWDQE